MSNNDDVIKEKEKSTIMILVLSWPNWESADLYSAIASSSLQRKISQTFQLSSSSLVQKPPPYGTLSVTLSQEQDAIPQSAPRKLL